MALTCIVVVVLEVALSYICWQCYPSDVGNLGGLLVEVDCNS